MRFALSCVVVLASASLSCGAGLNQTNGVKLGEALAFAAAAGAAQVAEAAAEQRARNNAPVTRSSTGASLSPGCNNSGQYACLTVTPSSPGEASAGDTPDPEMDYEEARDYVLGYVNGVRKLNGVGPVVRDDSLDTFAQAGSDELAQDHRANQHMFEHAPELRPGSAEVQGPPDGSRPGPLQEQIGELLLAFMGEGPGGMHHDTLLRPEWRKLGVGIATRRADVLHSRLREVARAVVPRWRRLASVGFECLGRRPRRRRTRPKELEERDSADGHRLSNRRWSPPLESMPPPDHELQRGIFQVGWKRK